jgi:hypothetical protein
MEVLQTLEDGKVLNDKVMKQIIILILFSLLMFSCKKVSISAAEMNPVELKKEILESGNSQAYVKFVTYQYGKEIDKDFLYISMKMYHEHNYLNALSYIYLGYVYKHNPKIPFLTGNVNELFVKVPKKEQEEALNYLKIGKEKGNLTCIIHLKEYYNYIGEIQKSEELSIYQNKIMEEHKKKSK